jgi:GTP-binding protein
MAAVSAPLRLEFATSADRVENLPPTRAEVAFVGRSNVGKSSLLNALAGRTSLAHTSKTPGRTRLLNLFVTGDGQSIVDCPGYGYAAVSKAQRASWQPMLERYLLEREELRMVAVLVDGEIGPTKLDVQMLEWLRANALPHQVIATKHDKVKSSQRERRKRDLAAACTLEKGDVVWVSAAKGTGIERLRGIVALWLN